MKKKNLHRLIDELPDDVVTRVEHDVPVMMVMRLDHGRPVLHEIDPEQWWFWTPEWQAGEREVDEEIAAGKGTVYYSTEEFIASLERDMESPE